LGVRVFPGAPFFYPQYPPVSFQYLADTTFTWNRLKKPLISCKFQKININLPKLNGIDALKVLRVHSNNREIPVNVHAAVAKPSEIATRKVAGFEDHLVNPIKVPEGLRASSKHMN